MIPDQKKKASFDVGDFIKASCSSLHAVGLCCSNLLYLYFIDEGSEFQNNHTLNRRSSSLTLIIKTIWCFRFNPRLPWGDDLTIKSKSPNGAAQTGLSTVDTSSSSTVWKRSRGRPAWNSRWRKSLGGLRVHDWPLRLQMHQHVAPLNLERAAPATASDARHFYRHWDAGEGLHLICQNADKLLDCHASAFGCVGRGAGGVSGGGLEANCFLSTFKNSQTTEIQDLDLC